MPKDASNDSISFNSRSVRAGNLAVGRGATIRLGDMTYQEQPDAAELALCLGELIEAVKEHRSSISGYDAVDDATSHLAAELQQGAPRRSRVLQLLGVIAQGAGSVASVASAVESLRTAVLAIP